MSKKKYSEKLRDPRWQKKRLKVLERDGWACRCCGDTENMLSVHHRRYIPKREPWDYPDELLVTLCSDCHNDERELRDEHEQGLLELLKDRFFVEEISCIADGFALLTKKYSSSDTAMVIKWILDKQFDSLAETYMTETYKGAGRGKD